ncbi:hypothetical protein [Kineococcus sp. SYSU DK006]|uniref:hypothetical protein n=1 Tax=Kineococcus sp. SYSU DK006 TaxID=3383127 RepID=UPI003D7E9486
MTPPDTAHPLTTAARRTVRASAGYDLLTTAGFALPFTAPALFAALGALLDAAGLPGSAPSPEVFTVLFANFTGSVVTVWSLYRLLRPSRAAGAADVAARGLFSLAMIAALSRGASPVLAIVLVLEIAWGFVQAGVLLSTRPRASSAPRLPVPSS